MNANEVIANCGSTSWEGRAAPNRSAQRPCQPRPILQRRHSNHHTCGWSDRHQETLIPSLEHLHKALPKRRPSPTSSSRVVPLMDATPITLGRSSATHSGGARNPSRARCTGRTARARARRYRRRTESTDPSLPRAASNTSRRERLPFVEPQTTLRPKPPATVWSRRTDIQHGRGLPEQDRQRHPLAQFRSKDEV